MALELPRPRAQRQKSLRRVPCVGSPQASKRGTFIDAIAIDLGKPDWPAEADRLFRAHPEAIECCWVPTQYGRLFVELLRVHDTSLDGPATVWRELGKQAPQRRRGCRRANGIEG